MRNYVLSEKWGPKSMRFQDFWLNLHIPIPSGMLPIKTSPSTPRYVKLTDIQRPAEDILHLLFVAA